MQFVIPMKIKKITIHLTSTGHKYTTSREKLKLLEIKNKYQKLFSKGY